MKLTATFRPPGLDVSIVPQTVDISTGNPIAREYVERPAYEGSYEITPATVEQVIPTKHLRMTDNITVAAIPNNYGLITWNGSIMTVS